jgi:hypothetical protein
MVAHDIEEHLSSETRKSILAGEISEVLAKLDVSFSTIVEDVVEHLFAKAESSGNVRERQVFLDAYTNIKKKRSVLENGFRESFRILLNDNISGAAKRNSDSDFQKSDFGELSLIGTDEIEENVAVRHLTDKIKASVEWELRDLNARMSYLLDREGAEESNNPLRPELFCRALESACRALDTDHQTRLEVMKCFEGALSQNISVVYQDLNARLISRRVLPKVRHVARGGKTPVERKFSADVEKDTKSAAPASPASLEALDNVVGEVVEGTLSMFEALQKLVGNASPYRQGTGAGAGNEANAHGLAQSRRNLLTAIQDLRSMQELGLNIGMTAAAPVIPGAAASAAVRSLGQPGVSEIGNASAMSNFIWANHEQLSSAAANNVDRMKIDIVAMLFDQIFADDKLPSEFKLLIGRMQLPVLRVALADGSFFASRAHPTRRLIDRMASCAIGYEGDAHHGAAFVAEIDRIVRNVLASVDENTAIYEQMLAEFESFLQREHTHSNDIVGRAADVLERAEVREVLSINATIQVNRLLYGVALEPFLKAFLLDVWTHVLVEAACLCEDSRNDPTVARFKQVCVDLVWSAQPKITAEERKQLVALLPKMIGVIREGLALIGYPPEQETRFFAELMQIHSLAIRASGGSQEPVDIEDFASRLEQMVVEQDMSAASGGAHVMLSPESLRRVEAESQGEIQLVDVPSVAGPSVHIEASSEDTVARWLATLERGHWFDLKVNGEFERVRLAWISPRKSFYLFIAARGERAHSLNPETLHALLRSHDLRAAEEAPLVERAVRSVMEKLETRSVH